MATLTEYISYDPLKVHSEKQNCRQLLPLDQLVRNRTKQTNNFPAVRTPKETVILINPRVLFE